MIRKRFQLNWKFECPDAVLTCSILKCQERNFLVFGGHDKKLYLMDEKMNILDDREFDGWCRCSFPVDLDKDGCDEVLVGARNFMVMKINPEKKKLIGLMRYKSTKRVNCCVGGDFTRNGSIDLIFGSEDKTIKIFDNIKAKEPKFILYYESWVTACNLGYLKLENEKTPIYGLLVGTKNGLLQLVQIKDGFPDILWNKKFTTQVNSIMIGDVTNDGLNEIILSTDDSTIKILTSEGELVNEIKIEEGRPLSLLIEDIDGDNAKEIIAGCADGSLKIYHNPVLNSNDFELKWKTKVATSIKDICVFPGDQQLHIVFGGYDRTIRNVSDFEWGQKQTLEIPQQIKIPEIQKGIEEMPIMDLTKIEEVPTNIRGHIFKILKKKGFLKDLLKELTELGYSREEISDQLEIMNIQKSIIYEKVVYPVWSSPEEEIETKVEIKAPIEKPKVLVKHMVIEEPEIADKERLRAVLPKETLKPSDTSTGKDGEGVTTAEAVSDASSIENIILDYLKQKKIVATKPLFVSDITAKGFAKNIVEKEINSLKVQGKITYSRAKPKGWSITN
ncbi:hypothetical protein LCGC14_1352030 [marine sediment metagenome]|uniref:Uncharacterized protein n=1 Tax=marine sediment metagenome TaxID=412755 RepID=A0A0F9KBB1_9ZZZZ